jgi:hypothetical protein
MIRKFKEFLSQNFGLPLKKQTQEGLTDYYARRMTGDYFGTTADPDTSGGGGTAFDTYMIEKWQLAMRAETEENTAPMSALVGDVPDGLEVDKNMGARAESALTNQRSIYLQA